MNTIMAQVPGNVPVSGLEAWYSFNGNGNDLSGNGNDLTNNGAVPTADRDGNAASAYSFSGSSQYLVVNSPSFSYAQTDSFTVSFWMEKTANQYGIALMQSSSTSGQFIWIFQTGLTGNCNFGTGKQQSGWTWANSPYGLNAWEHYVGTYSGGTMNLYKNGVFVTSSVFAHTGTTQAANPFRIGRSHTGNYFSGKIDDVGIWNRVLTQSEITALYVGCSAAFTIQPSDYTTTAGSNAQFGAATSNMGLTYQWQSDSSGTFQNLANNTRYQGSTTDTLNITGATISLDGVNFRCVASDGTTCSDTSQDANLKVCGAVTGQPADQTVPINSTVKFGLGLNDPNASYQWQATSNSGAVFVNLSNNANYSGIDMDTLTLNTATSFFDGKKYRCIYSTSICNDTSDLALLTIIPGVGLEEVPTQKGLIYPNPASDLINLKLSTESLNSHYRIGNTLGQIMTTGKIESEVTSINVEDFPKGTYFFILDDGMHTSFAKVN